MRPPVLAPTRLSPGFKTICRKRKKNIAGGYNPTPFKSGRKMFKRSEGPPLVGITQVEPSQVPPYCVHPAAGSVAYPLGGGGEDVGGGCGGSEDV